MSIRALRSIRNHFPRRTPTSSSKTVFQSDRGHFLAQGPRRFNWTHSSCAFSIVSSYSSRSIPPPRHCRSIQSSSTTLHPNSFQDSERADLFYHLLLTPPSSLSSSVPVFAVSFLPEPPASAYSKTVIGWLPAETPGAEDEAGLNDFKQNPAFLELLHQSIQSGLRDGIDEIQKNGAIQTQQGWMHIHDERNVPALGRIGDPDDILASVRVEEGKILADTYQPMPSYRLCTSDGIMQLSEGLATRLKEVLTKQNQAEKSG